MASNQLGRAATPPAPHPLRRPLCKTQSWSPDMGGEEFWLRQKGNNKARRKRASQSLTEDDFEELKACFELGFGFEPNSPELDPKLSGALPALSFYCSVNKQYDNLSRCSSSSSMMSESSGGGSAGSSNYVYEAGDDPQTVKTRLKQWAQVVACSVKHFSGEPR